MSTKHDDGGPVFSEFWGDKCPNCNEQLDYLRSPGMRWLDYAAIQIAARLFTSSEVASMLSINGVETYKEATKVISRGAYNSAEALLAEKRRRESE